MHHRLLSLDVFRGITVVLMILVNSPGNNMAYTWFEHSSWNGCTLADVVFPFFLLMVGVSIAYTLTNMQRKGMTLFRLLPRILKRTTFLFLVGLFLNAFPHHFDLETIRIFGVLQRTAICYFFAAILFLTISLRTQAILCCVLLLAYYVLMTIHDIPGYGLNDLSPEGNVAAYVDRMFFSSLHLYGKVYDPEGLLSTLPALVTTLFGNLLGGWLLSQGQRSKALIGMWAIGTLCCVAGWIWGYWFPINKALWTSSYVLWTGGIAILVFGICYWLIEMRSWTRWCKPLELFGVHALLAYFLHILFLKIQVSIMIVSGNKLSESLKQYLTEHLFGWATPLNASLFYAVSYMLFWMFILYAMSSLKALTTSQPARYGDASSF